MFVQLAEILVIDILYLAGANHVVWHKGFVQPPDDVQGFLLLLFGQGHGKDVYKRQAVFLVFVVLSAQFESPKFSFMVMTTIPFSLIGSFGLLQITGVSISMTSILGFLILVGTVVNNGILYVDTVNQYRMTMDLKTALIEAGATRLRPIMMTSLTTILSMIPMALAIGDNGSTTQGLAIVNIGGLSVGVAVALFILPIYYALMNGDKKRVVLDI